MLAVSAHWYVNATAALATPIPRTIHDCYGFPKALFDLEYAAQDDPERAVALEVPSWTLGRRHSSSGSGSSRSSPSRSS